MKTTMKEQRENRERKTNKKNLTAKNKGSSIYVIRKSKIRTPISDFVRKHEILVRGHPNLERH